MERPLVEKQPRFRPAKQISVYRVMLLLGLIIAGLWVFLAVQRGQVKPAFLPTPTPTRLPESFIEEAEAYFQAGKLDDPDPAPPAPPRYDAIDTYQRALKIDPKNAIAWARLARIQTYSSSLLSNDTDRLRRLEEAVVSINKAIEISPDDSTIRAIRAFVLDWYASSSLVADDRRAGLLTEAELEASRAFQLDPENNLALAFYAEVLLDQQKWSQAEQYAVQAVAGDPASMDAHRVKGTVLESLGQYRSAIEEYLAAAQINPNLTFLYVYAGRNYLRLRLYDKALEFYAKAADIDEQIGVKNPLPYVEIAKTYTQQGEFFVAAINGEKALSFDPTNANTYGQLGIIYIRSRNYEGAMPVLKCAVLGCQASENEVGKAAVTGLPLTNLSVAYYYVEYGTVLAFLSTANQDYCPEARQVLNQVSSAYPSDPILGEIVKDSLGICNRVDQGVPAGTPPAGEATPTSVATLPTATLTPIPVTPTP